MANSPKFHLVDGSGNPLDERYQTAAEELEQTFFNAFPQLHDPAVVSNTVEKSARKVARYEQKYGRVDNLPPFFLRVLLQCCEVAVSPGLQPTRSRKNG